VTAAAGADNLRPRGRGLLSGLAFADHKMARRVAAEAFRRNILIETSGPNAEVIKLMPPLTIEPALLDEGLGRLREAIDQSLQQERFRPAA
jgi:diaminobutyrate-2-oxoglutarate transaminase